MRTIPLLITLSLLLTACRTPFVPFAPIKGQQIVQIEVKPLSRMERVGHTFVRITNKDEINYVVQSIAALKPEGFDHSSPTFDLWFETSSGSRLKLRVSEIEVGPDAPASANNTHLFPSDKVSFRKFYDFLVNITNSNY